MAADGFAVGDVAVGEFLGGGQGEGLLLGHGGAGRHGAEHVVHGVHGVHGGGPGVGEGLVNGVGVDGEFFQVAAFEGAEALGEAVGGGGPDGAGAAHDHVGDGGGGLAIVFGGDDFELVRQEALLDEEHGVGGGVKSDSAIVAGPALDGDIHKDWCDGC